MVVEELCRGCRVDEAFTGDDLVDSISADTSGLRCGRVKVQVLGLTWIRPGSILNWMELK